MLTTSPILHRYLDSLRCTKNRDHAHVAGNYKIADGTWRPVSEFSELYTRTFGQRVARTLAAFKLAKEHSIVQIESICFGDEEPDGPEPKRRRLSFKVSHPPGYPESPEAVVNRPSPSPDMPEACPAKSSTTSQSWPS